MSVLERIQRAVRDLSNNSPLLILSGAVVEFKRAVRAHIYELSNIESVREFLDGVIGSTRVLVVDVSDVGERGIGILLKFVEEYEYPLVVLDSRDRVGDVFTSRMRTVISGGGVKTYSEFGSFRSYLHKNNSSDLYGDALYIVQGRECPQAYLYGNRIRRDMLYKVGEILD